MRSLQTASQSAVAASEISSFAPLAYKS